MRFDLHSHSTNSDGEHSVDRVAVLMAEAGVKHWALY
jgi:predicted metal-dependent phosphoesterase TrpH